MKQRLIILYHMLRMERNWNKCKRILANTGKPHDFLYIRNWAYCKASLIYQESRDFLVSQGVYVTAVQEIARYQKVAAA